MTPEPRFVDLHTHSTASDGSMAPSALMRAAAGAGLAVIALTDHDTWNGIAEARAAAGEEGVRLVAGIEISADWPAPGEMHILGHFVDDQSEALGEMSRILLEARGIRNPKIVARLNELGCGVTMEQVEAIAHRGVPADQPVVVGRPHIAEALVESKCVANMKQAFDVYLGTTGAAYFPKERLTPRQAIECIHKTGGLATLAHPIRLRTENPAHLQTVLNHLAEAGMDGLECWHSDHDEKWVELCLELAKRYALIPTGGSDFHGSKKLDIRLGQGRGNVRVPYEVFERLEARWKQKRHAELV
jgi:predicted metal-dependent phosphoesterase TrpH